MRSPHGLAGSDVAREPYAAHPRAPPAGHRDRRTRAASRALELVGPVGQTTRFFEHSVAAEECHNAAGGLRGVLMLPDSHYGPTLGRQLCVRRRSPGRDCPRSFLATSWRSPSATSRVSGSHAKSSHPQRSPPSSREMPHLPGDQPRGAPRLYSIPEAQRMETSSQGDLGCRVARSVRPHAPPHLFACGLRDQRAAEAPIQELTSYPCRLHKLMEAMPRHQYRLLPRRSAPDCHHR